MLVGGCRAARLEKHKRYYCELFSGSSVGGIVLLEKPQSREQAAVSLIVLITPLRRVVQPDYLDTYYVCTGKLAIVKSLRKEKGRNLGFGGIAYVVY